MPRFGTKVLLIAVAIVALWLATLTGFSAGGDVRHSILLMVYVAALLAAIYSRGRERAFWIGFFAVMPVVIVVPSGSLGGFFVPQFGWVPYLTQPYGIGPSGSEIANNVYQAFEDTVRAFWFLGLSSALGYIGAAIYDRSQKVE
jgi:hypothetical protein